MLKSDGDRNPLVSNSPHAWESLIESVGPASLLVVIESRMSNELRRAYSADDVLQDALLLAWRDRMKCEWRGLRSFRAWLLTIIDHRIRDAADYCSARKRGGAGRDHTSSADFSRPVADGGAVDEIAAITTTPSRVASYREQAVIMRCALAELPDELREVVRFRLFEQLTMEQIAERLGIGASAVRYRFGRGVEQYQKNLAVLVSRSRSIAATPGHRVQ